MEGDSGRGFQAVSINMEDFKTPAQIIPDWYVDLFTSDFIKERPTQDVQPMLVYGSAMVTVLQNIL